MTERTGVKMDVAGVEPLTGGFRANTSATYLTVGFACSFAYERSSEYAKKSVGPATLT